MNIRHSTAAAHPVYGRCGYCTTLHNEAGAAVGDHLSEEVGGGLDLENYLTSPELKEPRP
jgi:hypothetical protein